MAKFILGRKLNMTQKFMEDGIVVPVTAVKAGPCTITQIKGDKEGYSSVQVGFDNKRKINKPLAGHLKNLSNFRFLREFRIDNTENLEKGKTFDLTTFEVGDIVQVSGTSKGKGFQGVVKRWGFKGGPASHGHKDQNRMPGSIGSTGPARVFKGTRMGGRMGGDTITVENLEIIEVDTENGILYIKGAVPGARNGLITIKGKGELTFVEKKKEVKEEKVEEVKEEKKVEEKVEEDKKETPKEEKKTDDKSEDIKEEKKVEDKVEDKKEEKK